MTCRAPAQCLLEMKKRIQCGLAFAVLVGSVLISSSPVHAASGNELFAKHCASCHGKDGKAQTPAARKLGVKDLTQSKAADGEVEKQIIYGKKDDRGKMKMPPFKDKLSAEEISSLVVLVKGLRN